MRVSVLMLPGGFMPQRPSAWTACSITSIATLVSTSGRAPVPWKRPRCFLCIAAILGLEIRESDREGPDRAHHLEIMAETVEMREQGIEIEPFAAHIGERPAAFPAAIDIAALAVGRGDREILALANPLENRAGPPVKMGIDDAH